MWPSEEITHVRRKRIPDEPELTPEALIEALRPVRRMLQFACVGIIVVAVVLAMLAGK